MDAQSSVMRAVSTLSASASSQARDLCGQSADGRGPSACAGYTRVDTLPIEHDLWRFYHLHP